MKTEKLTIIQCTSIPDGSGQMEKRDISGTNADF